MRRPRRNPPRAGVLKLFGSRRRVRASRQRSGDSAAPSNERAQPAPEREPRAAPALPKTIAPPDLEQLEAEERYHRDRLALYRARSYGSRPTSPARLRELGRIWEAAKARLIHARSQRR